LGSDIEMTVMGISANFSALGRTKWYEFVVRFVFGGAITVGAGILAKKYGPAVGGLFLAFPAIFLASITLVERHELQKKRRAGLDGSDRARKAAALDAAGAAMGSFGLIGFAFTIYKWLTQENAAVILAVASNVWFAVSVMIWRLRKTHRWF
jgi:hypothetical protein